MKTASPLSLSASLLLFLQLASAAPTTEDPNPFPSDCHYTSCTSYRSSLPAAESESEPHTPPTRLTTPHFPSHQLLSSPDTLKEASFDNTPVTPSESTGPSAALASEQPLSSAYLLSLANPAASPSIQKAPHHIISDDALPSKPTSALAALRQEDAVRYWTSLRPASTRQAGETTGSDGPRFNVQLCGAGNFISDHYITLRAVHLSRDYSDLLVVGIVMLFLIVVVVLEMVERMGDLNSMLTGRRCAKRGDIYLEDDETLAYIVKKPVSPQVDAPHYQILTGECVDEKEAFQYDSDADMRV
ncbi:hypothetical protein LZ554_005740 [Drepanopeziza brunnea f. sp. 'monogermtubi']|nr:hypothetical protein LZ554_005740 [Drepanopeziza brunnea f. sp. 'monogermtubi']